MDSVFVPSHSRYSHLEQVEQRWKELLASNDLQARAGQVQEAMDHGAFVRMLGAARKARTNASRVVWLQRAADVVGRAVLQAKAAPCKKGCNHCCHIPLLISRSEATMLASASGRGMATTPRHAVQVGEELDQWMQDGKADVSEGRWLHHYGSPCPFLKDEGCSVWESRPLTCRYHYSLDTDDLLCRLVDKDVQVPRLNMVAQTTISWTILGLNQEAADIRDWFPGLPESDSVDAA